MWPHPFLLKIYNWNFANEKVVSQRHWHEKKKENVTKVAYQSQNTVATSTAISWKKIAFILEDQKISLE